MAKDSALTYKRIVVKFGTSLLTGGAKSLDRGMMASLVDQVARLHQLGHEMLIVTSGAVASGRDCLGPTPQVKGIPYKQVLAAVGQGRLMATYEQLFAPHNLTIAQALLTKGDIADRSGYLNTRNTLLALLELGVIGIINENDVVAVDELRGLRFGDNDNLSAMVANLVDADLLLILTDIAGLYTADPRKNPQACLIPEVTDIAAVEHLAGDTQGKLGTGGMITKIEAARLATASGVTVVIADGRVPDVIVKLAAGAALGTCFRPQGSRHESRARWLVSGLAVRGRVIVDEGADLALKKHKGSLLAAGIKDTGGDFQRGETVDVFNTAGERLGCGITNYGAAELALIKGKRSSEINTILGHDYGPEVVHRNNLVLL
jgi:glutamate 5-kinase